MEEEGKVRRMKCISQRPDYEVAKDTGSDKAVNAQILGSREGKSH